MENRPEKERPLHCPLCEKFGNIHLLIKDNKYGITCVEDCGSNIEPKYDTEEEAIKAWNALPRQI